MVVSGPWPGWTTVASGRVRRPVADALDQGVVVASRQVGSPDGTGEQGVAGKEVSLGEKADPSRGMAGNMDDFEVAGSPGEELAAVQGTGGGRGGHVLRP